ATGLNVLSRVVPPSRGDRQDRLSKVGRRRHPRPPFRQRGPASLSGRARNAKRVRRAFCLCMLAHGLVRSAQWLLAGRLVSGHSHSLAAKEAHVSPNSSLKLSLILRALLVGDELFSAEFAATI